MRRVLNEEPGATSTLLDRETAGQTIWVEIVKSRWMEHTVTKEELQANYDLEQMSN